VPSNRATNRSKLKRLWNQHGRSEIALPGQYIRWLSPELTRKFRVENAGQLEQLVAPIALYPDNLIAIVVAAST